MATSQRLLTGKRMRSNSCSSYLIYIYCEFVSWSYWSSSILTEFSFTVAFKRHKRIAGISHLIENTGTQDIAA